MMSLDEAGTREREHEFQTVSDSDTVSASWSQEEAMAFEQALQQIDCKGQERWEQLAARFPNKTVQDMKNRISFLSTLFNSWIRGKPAGPPIEGTHGLPWSHEEHVCFLAGLAKYGKGQWRRISRLVVHTRTPAQVASHAQKYFNRQQRSTATSTQKPRRSIHDIMIPGSDQAVSEEAGSSDWQGQEHPGSSDLSHGDHDLDDFASPAAPSRDGAEGKLLQAQAAMWEDFPALESVQQEGLSFGASPTERGLRLRHTASHKQPSGTQPLGWSQSAPHASTSESWGAYSGARMPANSGAAHSLHSAEHVKLDHHTSYPPDNTLAPGAHLLYPGLNPPPLIPPAAPSPRVELPRTAGDLHHAALRTYYDAPADPSSHLQEGWGLTQAASGRLRDPLGSASGMGLLGAAHLGHRQPVVGQLVVGQPQLSGPAGTQGPHASPSFSLPRPSESVSLIAPPHAMDARAGAGSARDWVGSLRGEVTANVSEATLAGNLDLKGRWKREPDAKGGM